MLRAGRILYLGATSAGQKPVAQHHRLRTHASSAQGLAGRDADQRLAQARLRGRVGHERPAFGLRLQAPLPGQRAAHDQSGVSVEQDKWLHWFLIGDDVVADVMRGLQ